MRIIERFHRRTIIKDDLEVIANKRRKKHLKNILILHNKTVSFFQKRRALVDDSMISLHRIIFYRILIRHRTTPDDPITFLIGRERTHDLLRRIRRGQGKIRMRVIVVNRLICFYILLQRKVLLDHGRFKPTKSKRIHHDLFFIFKRLLSYRAMLIYFFHIFGKHLQRMQPVRTNLKQTFFFH